MVLVQMKKKERDSGFQINNSSSSLQKWVVLFFFFFTFCLQHNCFCQVTEITSGNTNKNKNKNSIISTAPPPAPPSSSPLRSRAPYTFLLSIVVGVVTGLISALLFACLVRCFIRHMKRTPILKGPVVFSPNITPNTLQSALANANETHLIGGSYFSVLLDNGLTFAVKRIDLLHPRHQEEEAGAVGVSEGKMVKRKIQEELELLASLKHRNLMSLRAYVCESHRYSLVYDYVPTGSLEDAMRKVRENQLQLSWDVRLRIAVGVIKGLQYLHFISNPRIMHYNLKPSNVLLDAEFEPRITDCGLPKLLPGLLDTPASAYNAPECFPNCRYNDKSDIFSFGVILGVLLTGRDPMDQFFGETSSGGSLGRWLHHVQEAGEAREALDKSIVGEEVEEDEMLMAVRIAVVCLSDLPADRPSSDELVPMLTQLHSF